MTALLAQVSEGPPWNFYEHAKIQGDSLIHTTRASWTTRASPEVPSTWFGPVARGAVSAVLTLWPMYRSSKPVKCSTEMSHTVGEATRNWLYQSFRYNLISVHRLKSWNFNCDSQVIFFKFLLTMISWKKFSSSFRWNIQMNDFSVTCTFSEHIFISYNFYLLIFNTFKLYLLRFFFQMIFLCLYYYFCVYYVLHAGCAGHSCLLGKYILIIIKGMNHVVN